MVGMYFFYICNFLIYFHHSFFTVGPFRPLFHFIFLLYILYILVQYMDRIELFAADELTSECLSINDGEIVPPAPAENILQLYSRVGRNIVQLYSRVGQKIFFNCTAGWAEILFNCTVGWSVDFFLIGQNRSTNQRSGMILNF